MDEMQKLGGPTDIWDTTVFLKPGYEPISLYRALCFYSPSTGNITARTARDSTIHGCLPHEFAHRWVTLSKIDIVCTDSDVHMCPGFIEVHARLRKAACKGSWLGGVDCKTLP